MRLQPHSMLIVTVVADATTTLYAVYVLELREASPITALGLSLLGPAYFVLQFLILLVLVKVLERRVKGLGYLIPLTQWFAAWQNLGHILKVVLWS